MENMEMEQTLVQKCIESSSNKDYLTAVNKLCEDILTANQSLLQVVENLSDSLTNINAEKRGKGLRILGDIINILPKTYFQVDEVNYFITFFVERLKDTLVNSETLYGLRIMSSINDLSFQQVDVILSGIFQEVFTQSLVQKDREHVFTIFHNFLNFYLDEVMLMDLKFVNGFIQAMEGEKDPRNLLVLFNLVPVVIKNFNIDLVAESFFEVIACYFPIDYSPPPNDVRGIKKSDLVSGLRSCLTCTVQFAEYFLPLLLEKLDSDMIAAKLDTFDTLIECCKIYKWHDLKSYYTEIWKPIRREVFTTTNSDVKNAALNVVTAVFKTTSPRATEVDSNNEYESLMKEILDECVTYLSQQDVNYFIATASLLNALSLSTIETANKVFKITFSMILNRYALSAELNHRKLALDAIVSFLNSHQVMFQTGSPGLIFPFKRSLLSTFFGIVDGDEPTHLKCSAIDGLLVMSGTELLLDTNELQKFADLLVKQINERDCETFSGYCILTLSKLSTSSTSSFIYTRLLPQIMQNITAIINKNVDDKNNLEAQLNIVTAITKDKKSIKTVIPQLIDNLKAGRGENVDHIINCINSIGKETLYDDSLSEFWITEVALPTLQIAQTNSSCSTELFAHFKNVALLWRTIITQLGIGKAKKIFNFLLENYPLSCEDQSSSSEKTIADKYLVIIWHTLYGSAKRELFSDKEIVDKFDIVECLITRILHMIKNELSEDFNIYGYQCVASILNKFPKGNQLDKLIENVLNNIKTSFKYSCSPTDLKLVQLLIWAIKALVMRNHSRATDVIALLLSCLENESLSGVVAKEFHFILMDCNNSLNQACHADVGLLYKQRFFQSNYQKLIDGFHNSSQEIKCNYLTALVSQLTLIPKEIFIAEALNLMPILIKGLIMNDSQLLLSILSTLSVLIQTNSNVAEQYFDTMIELLLPLTTFKDSMKVRIEALQCLARFTILPTYVIVKRKQEVIQQLTNSLDDHKRLVRKAAAVARSQWCGFILILYVK